MERNLQDWQHDYRATPSDYPIQDNNRPATYDQFITLRDTLIFSNKYYADKAWRSLIIWTKLDWTPTDTIEIREPNISKMAFEPWFESDPTNKIVDETQWKYVTSGNNTAQPSALLSCTIQKDWRYRITHKEQFVNLDSSSITRIHTYVNQWIKHTIDNFVYWDQVPRAVYDFEWSTAWEMVRVPAYWFIECDLHKSDVLVLEMKDQNDDPISSSYLQTNSNWWSVEYIDLAYNN